MYTEIVSTIFQEGEWKHVVNNPSGGICNARLRIEGFPDTSSPDDDKQPILMTSLANKVNVDVQIGTAYFCSGMCTTCSFMIKKSLLHSIQTNL